VIRPAVGFTVSVSMLLMFPSINSLAHMNSLAQRTTVVRTNVRQIIRNLETDTDTFKGSLDRALDHSPLDGTRSEDEINEYVKQFEHATDKLKDKAEDQKYAPNLAREVLLRGRSINTFMRKHQLSQDANNDWARVRNDLTLLAHGYRINWRW
jgi:DNA repair ATPase RecN